MQGHASGHSTAYQSDELLEQGIRLIQWPAYSPDLDPIEKEWDWMKDWIDDHYPSKLNYDQLRRADKVAWDAVPNSFLQEQIDLMHGSLRDCYKSWWETSFWKACI